MTVTVEQMTQEWIAETPAWGAGADDIPTNDSNPTLFELEQSFQRGESKAMERLAPKLRQVTDTFVTADGIRGYNELDDMWDKQFLNLSYDLNGDSQQIQYIDWNRLVALRPDWLDTDTTRGRPQYLTFRPENGNLEIYPTPDAVYTISAVYQRVPPPLAFPAKGNWYLGYQDITAGTIWNVGEDPQFLHRGHDRARTLLSIVTSTRTVGTNKVYFTGTILGATLRIEFTIPTGSAVNQQVSTYNSVAQVLDSLISVEADAANTDTLTLSVGTGSTYSDTNTSENSLLPDHWALRIGPGYASYEFLDRLGQESEAQKKLAKWERDVDEFVKRYNRPPISAGRLRVMAPRATPLRVNYASPIHRGF